MNINFSELSTEEIRSIIERGKSVLDSRTNLVIMEKARAIMTLIDEIYDIVDNEGGDTNATVKTIGFSYDLSLSEIREIFEELSWEKFLQEEEN